ncbi:hypothetical protein A9Q81_07965 [Gammaproteobacteria bacterium 42_54_T18]|nr:hypothetical protein A9Q81_07965 [Gammaproteobacteria bacterium 42_54_T18]
MSVEFLMRAILIASLTLLTSACGGGGGGGSDSPAAEQTGTGSDTSDNEDESAAEEEGTAEPYVFTRTQFEYLPFTDGTSIQYNDGSTASVTLDTNEFANKSVYAVVNNGTTLYLSTTATKMALHGVDGSIEISGNGISTTVEKLRFHDKTSDEVISIPLLYSTTAEDTEPSSTPIQAIGKATTSNFGTRNINELSVSSKFVNTELTSLTYGALQARKLTLAISGMADAVITEIFVTFTDTLYLTSGIGIVKHQSTDYGIDNEITSLTGLPTTIWFNNAAGTPTIDSESDPTFSIAGIGAISSTTYRVANIDALNETPWLTIQEDTASNTFNVDMTTHEDLPTTLTSVEVIFENKETNKHLSGNVTIQPLN